MILEALVLAFLATLAYASYTDIKERTVSDSTIALAASISATISYLVGYGNIYGRISTIFLIFAFAVAYFAGIGEGDLLLAVASSPALTFAVTDLTTLLAMLIILTVSSLCLLTYSLVKKKEAPAATVFLVLFTALFTFHFLA